MDTKCSTPKCSRDVYARTLCAAHYQRARAAGELPPSAVTEKPCAHCGSVMAGRVSTRAKFCSPQCKERARTAANHAALVERLKGRTCVECGSEVPTSKASQAITCSIACAVKYQNKKRADAVRAANLEGRGPCLRCGSEIPESKRSHARFCSRDCTNAARKARNYDSERARDLNRQYLYGITSEQVDELLEAQGGGCAICGSDEWGDTKPTRPQVDHCHGTGRIRGVLCNSCNNGLGRFGDDPSRLRAAAEYLER